MCSPPTKWFEYQERRMPMDPLISSCPGGNTRYSVALKLMTGLLGKPHHTQCWQANYFCGRNCQETPAEWMFWVVILKLPMRLISVWSTWLSSQWLITDLSLSIPVCVICGPCTLTDWSRKLIRARRNGWILYWQGVHLLSIDWIVTWRLTDVRYWLEVLDFDRDGAQLFRDWFGCILYCYFRYH
jgi:hypothetical protein